MAILTQKANSTFLIQTGLLLKYSIPEQWIDLIFGFLKNLVRIKSFIRGFMLPGSGAFTLSLATDGTLSYVTASLVDNISDADLKTVIENLLDKALNDTGEFDMTVYVTTTRGVAGTPDRITSLIIEIAGDQAGRPLPLTMFYSGNVLQGAMREIQGARKNSNIFSNIPELY